MSARGFARLCWLVAVIVVFVSPAQAQQSNASALSKAQLGATRCSNRTPSRCFALPDADGLDLSD